MRNSLEITEERLRTCLMEHYDVTAATIVFLPLGLDYSSAVYHVVSPQGAAYLLKLTSKPVYEPQYRIPRFLHDQGIAEVVAPLSTKRGSLWTRLADWTVAVYPYIDGDSSFDGMSAGQWKQVGTIFARIHRIGLPPQGLGPIRRESFDSAVYVWWIRTLEDQLARWEGGSEPERALHASWVEHRLAIHAKLDGLIELAASLRERAIPLVICHADLHPANVIRDQAGHAFIIDWDDVMLAPKERDFIFAGPPHDQDFFQGYGAVEVDETVLAYYRAERVLQDLIACARNVWLQDDLGEDAKADAVELFQRIMMAESTGRS
ncbi:phosphotransferase enzyme family protein [Paenibacillus sp. GCM10023250]|uniref:phosphotransferase enzyme family protein n=1 Tax=Paenibacillus sp. GCM10023250 TaxID=3252648 RepID=UPI0036114779